VSAVQSFEPSIITVTPRAASKVAELVAEEGNPALKLRVYVTGGGCSGFQYGFSFEEAVADDDSVVSAGAAEVVIDALSYPYLVGSELDYLEGLEGARFLIRNPNASTTCGCGSSFSI
jgi:iron-sulfur cluster insertion protein